MWRLYIIYHRYIRPEFHDVDPQFSKESVHLMQTSGYKKTPGFPKDYSSRGYTTHKESDFRKYDPGLQKRKYFAPSVLYHVFKNDWYEEDYLGFLEYDFRFQVSEKDVKKLGLPLDLLGKVKSPCQFIEKNLQKGRIIVLSARWRLQELNAQTAIRVSGLHWLDYFIQEYQNYCHMIGVESKISKEELLLENPIIPTQQSFICDVESFKRIMGFIVYLIDHSLLEKAWPAPATILERYIGLCIHLCDSEVMYLPLQHQAHHGYQL